VNVRNWPRTLLIIMWRIEKPIVEWAGSSSQVAARPEAGTSNADGEAPARANGWIDAWVLSFLDEIGAPRPGDAGRVERSSRRFIGADARQ
jgi:hypothetical protein